MNAAFGVILALLLGLGAAGYAAAAPDGNIAISFDDERTLVASISMQESPLDAFRTRQQADTSGDAFVDAHEADAWQQQMARLFGSADIGLPLGRAFVDTMPHETTIVRGVLAEGLEGPVAEEAFVFEVAMEMQFPSPTVSVYLFEIDTMNFTQAGFIQLDVGVLSITPPPGYTVNGTGGLPLGSNVARDGSVATVPSPERGSGWFVIQFAPSSDADEEASMAVAPLLVAFVVATCIRAACLRRL